MLCVISRYWLLEIKSAKEKNRKPWLLRAIMKTYGKFYFFVGLIQLVVAIVFMLVSVIKK